MEVKILAKYIIFWYLYRYNEMVPGIVPAPVLLHTVLVTKTILCPIRYFETLL